MALSEGGMLIYSMEKQLKLEFQQDESVKPNGAVGDTCQHCVHLFRHRYNADLKYCSLQPRRHPATATGYKKIKSRDPACWRFQRAE